jgi:hypothetical protein
MLLRKGPKEGFHTIQRHAEASSVTLASRVQPRHQGDTAVYVVNLAKVRINIVIVIYLSKQ